MSQLPMDCDAVDEAAGGFALGALEADEAAAIRDHLATCDRGHPMLAELRAVVPVLALAADAIEPANSLRARVLAQVAPAEPPQPVASRAADRPGRRLRWGIAVLAAVLIVGLTGVTTLLTVRLRDALDYGARATTAATLAGEPGSRSIQLAPSAGGGPGGTAVVAADGRAIVLLENLSPTSGSQVYEVWVIAAGGAPVPAGELRTTVDGRGWLEVAAAPSPGLTVAVTLEPHSGARTPTLPILAAGASG